MATTVTSPLKIMACNRLAAVCSWEITTQQLRFVALQCHHLMSSAAELTFRSDTESSVCTVLSVALHILSQASRSLRCDNWHDRSLKGKDIFVIRP